MVKLDEPFTELAYRCARYVVTQVTHLELLIDLKDRFFQKKGEVPLHKYYLSQLRFSLKQAITGINPHQIDAQNPFASLPPCLAVRRALWGLADYHLHWQGRLVFREKRLSAFCKLSQKIVVDQLGAGLINREYEMGRLPNPILPHCTNETMPHLATPELEALFKRGLIDLHQHFFASNQPSNIWAKAVRHPKPFLDELYNFKDDKEHLPDGWAKGDLCNHLYHARDIRDLLVEILAYEEFGGSRPNDPELLGYIKDLAELSEGIRYTRQRIHLKRRRKPPDPKSPLVENERYFLSRALSALPLDPHQGYEYHPFLVGFALHYYLLIQNLFMQNYVQQDDHFGFESFSRYERGTGLQAYKERTFAEAEPGYVRDHRLIKIELRIVPPLERNAYKDWMSKVFQATNNPQGIKDWGLIFHAVKQPDENDKGKYQIVRHHTVRRDTYLSLRALWSSRLWVPELSNRYLALDAANDERFTGPEVFAPSFRLFRDRFARLPRNQEHHDASFPLKPLSITFHAGESFEHPLSGMRYVAEAIEFIKMRPGDRIGHALALGIDIERWHQVTGDVVVISKRGQWLDDLLWMLDLGYQHNLPAGICRYLAHQIDDLAQQCYCDGLISRHGNLRRIHYLIRARPFRACEPSRYLQRVEPIFGQEVASLKQSRPYAYQLWHHYHYCSDCRRRYNQPYLVNLANLPPRRTWFDALKMCQQIVLDQLSEKHIAIETNPTSNLRIASFSQMRDHPIFTWFPVDPAERKRMPAVTVNGDNYCVFQTTLPLEYAYLAQAAEERGYTKRQIMAWLEEIRQNGFDYAFLP